MRAIFIFSIPSLPSVWCRHGHWLTQVFSRTITRTQKVVSVTLKFTYQRMAICSHIFSCSDENFSFWSFVHYGPLMVLILVSARLSPRHHSTNPPPSAGIEPGSTRRSRVVYLSARGRARGERGEGESQRRADMPPSLRARAGSRSRARPRFSPALDRDQNEARGGVRGRRGAAKISRARSSLSGDRGQSRADSPRRALPHAQGAPERACARARGAAICARIGPVRGAPCGCAPRHPLIMRDSAVGLKCEREHGLQNQFDGESIPEKS